MCQKHPRSRRKRKKRSAGGRKGPLTAACLPAWLLAPAAAAWLRSACLVACLLAGSWLGPGWVLGLLLVCSSVAAVPLCRRPGRGACVMPDLDWIRSELPDYPAAQPQLVGAGATAAAVAAAAASSSASASTESPDDGGDGLPAPAAAGANNPREPGANPRAIKHPCPVCLERSEDYQRGEKRCLFCSGCGHSVCCECKDSVLAASSSCPQCRSDYFVDDETAFNQLVQLLKRPAGKHTVGALLNLGVRYNNGEGTPRDPAEAVSCWRKAAQFDAESSGSFFAAIAMYNLGAHEYDERPEKAMEWFAQAARRGHTEARVDLGNMLMQRQQFSLGRRLLLAAAEEGHGEAELALAVHYSNPNEHGDRDFLASYRYISRACVVSTMPERTHEGVRQAKQIREQLLTYVNVRYQLGMAYLAGTAGHWTSRYPLMKLPPLSELDDYAMARKWLGSAAEAGHDEATALLQSMETAKENATKPPAAMHYTTSHLFYIIAAVIATIAGLWKAAEYNGLTNNITQM
jgi:TPR repeat protein